MNVITFIFCDVTPCRLADGFQHFGEAWRLLVHITDLKMAATYSSETFLDYFITYLHGVTLKMEATCYRVMNQITRCHIPEVTDIHSHLHENLKTFTAYSGFRFAALCLDFEHKDNNTLKRSCWDVLEQTPLSFWTEARCSGLCCVFVVIIVVAITTTITIIININITLIITVTFVVDFAADII